MTIKAKIIATKEDTNSTAYDAMSYRNCRIKNSLEIRIIPEIPYNRMIHLNCGFELRPEEAEEFEKHFRQHRHGGGTMMDWVGIKYDKRTKDEKR